jgi:hypothetical protein
MKKVPTMGKMLLAGVAALSVLAVPAASAAYADEEITTPLYIRGQWCYVRTFDGPHIAGIKEFRRGQCRDNYITFTKYGRFSKWGETSNECRITNVSNADQGWDVSLSCEGNFTVKYRVWSMANNRLGMWAIESEKDPPLGTPPERISSDYAPMAQPLSSCAIVDPPNDENWRPGLLNVRETPDLKSKILRQLSARDNIRLTSQAGEWVRMNAIISMRGEVEAVDGWVARKHLIMMHCPLQDAVAAPYVSEPPAYAPDQQPFPPVYGIEPAPEVKDFEWCRNHDHKDAACIDRTPEALPKPSSTVPGLAREAT